MFHNLVPDIMSIAEALLLFVLKNIFFWRQLNNYCKAALHRRTDIHHSDELLIANIRIPVTVLTDERRT